MVKAIDPTEFQVARASPWPRRRGKVGRADDGSLDTPIDPFLIIETEIMPAVVLLWKATSGSRDPVQVPALGDVARGSYNGEPSTNYSLRLQPYLVA